MRTLSGSWVWLLAILCGAPPAGAQQVGLIPSAIPEPPAVCGDFALAAEPVPLHPVAAAAVQVPDGPWEPSPPAGTLPVEAKVPEARIERPAILEYGVHDGAAGGQQAPCPCHEGERNWRPGDFWRNRLKPRLQERHWGYADLFEEVPLGARVNAHVSAQIVNGMVSRMVLYRYDFSQGSVEEASHLNQHGRERLSQLADMFTQNIHPLVIERVPNAPELNAARREHVLKRLEASGLSVPDEWVVVGKPRNPGLAGPEALEIHENLLRQTQSGRGNLFRLGIGNPNSGGMQGTGGGSAPGY